MQNHKQDGDLVYESDLNDFDLREDVFSAEVSPVIKLQEHPIGVYRVLRKGGIPVSGFIENL